MADSADTLGVDLRTRVKSLGAKEKARRKKCKLRFSSIKKKKNYMKVGVKKLLRAAMMPARTWRGACSRNFSHGKVKTEETDGNCNNQKEYNLLVFLHGGIRP